MTVVFPDPVGLATTMLSWVWNAGGSTRSCTLFIVVKGKQAASFAPSSALSSIVRLANLQLTKIAFSRASFKVRRTLTKGAYLEGST